jgi:hypothetical protein
MSVVADAIRSTAATFEDWASAAECFASRVELGREAHSLKMARQFLRSHGEESLKSFCSGHEIKLASVGIEKDTTLFGRSFYTVGMHFPNKAALKEFRRAALQQNPDRNLRRTLARVRFKLVNDNSSLATASL